MEEAFSLEVEGWEDTSLQQDELTAKRPKLSLSLKRKGAPSTATRFEFVDDAREEALSKKFVPKNTMQWAFSTFLARRDKRNECFKDQPDKLVPLDLLGSADFSK